MASRLGVMELRAFLGALLGIGSADTRDKVKSGVLAVNHLFECNFVSEDV